MNIYVCVTLLLSSCLAAAGQVMLKIGVDRFASTKAWLTIPLLLGVGFYGVGVTLWMWGLSRAPLYVVYPFAILTFVWVGALGIVCFGHRPNGGVIAGWVFIVIGLVLIQRFAQ